MITRTLNTVMSNSTVLVLLILVLINFSKSCEITQECPTTNTNNLIWAKNDKVCHVFHNECFLNNVNCHHENNKESKLEVTTKDECQKLCVSKCPEENEPVCGYTIDNAKQHSFKNQCEMDAHICKTGEPYFVYGVGPCEVPDVKEEKEEETA